MAELKQINPDGKTVPGAFNSEDHEEKLAPDGTELTGIIYNSDIKRNKADTGDNIVLFIRVETEGDHQGNNIIENLSYIHPNPQTQQIANRSLSDLIKACGKKQIKNTEELHGIPFRFIAKLNPETAQFPESNSVKRYIGPASGGGAKTGKKF